MADDKITPQEAEREFWKHLSNGTTVMLGINDASRHTQPMTAFAEPENNVVYFFTRDDLDLAREAVAGKNTRLILMSRDREVYGDIRGSMTCVHDRARIDRYWGPMVAAWYPEGKDDPHLTLLRFVPEEGRLWVSTKNVVSLAFEVVKANVTHTMPKTGGVADVAFRH